MTPLFYPNACRFVFSLLAAIGIAAPAMADNDRRFQQVPMLSKYQQECAACHVAYPPGMLPAASWQRLLNNLPHHYGTDASLDPATVKQLATWLTSYAGTYTRGNDSPPEDRITRSAWFIRQHDEVSAATWKFPAVKSAANCIACHTQSDKGDFNERHIRIPR
jgi:mono/diheme cytochrome c family protein